jgi:uncharacterized membrane protein (DUF4010 family)
MAMAERSRTAARGARAAAVAAVLASTVMAVRIAVLAGSVDAGVLPRLLPVVAAMGGAGVVAAWWLGRGGRREAGDGTVLRNPFSLRHALTFGAIYAVVLLMVHGLGAWLGARGMYLGAFLSAIADVDAPTIALTRLGSGSESWREPAAAIAVAAVTNTLVKGGLAVALGAGRFRLEVAAALASMAAAGAVAGVLVWAR